MNTVVRRLGHLADVVVSSVDKHSHADEVPVRLCNYVDVYHNEDVHPGLDLMAATASADEVDRFRLRAGDTVFTKDSETADDIGVPAYVSGDAPDFVCGYHLAIARPRAGRVDPKYLFWWLRSREAAQLWEVRASGVTRVGLRQADIRGLPMEVVPNVYEQHAIADCLDRETAQIDATIDAQEHLVALLEERRVGAVLRAVTRGMRGGVLMRDAPVGWAAEIPAHWAVVRVGLKYGVSSGQAVSAARAVEDDADGVPYVRAANIQPHGVDLSTVKYMRFSDDELRLLALRRGDLLVVEGGQGGYGRSAVLHQDLPGWGYQNHVLRVRPLAGDSNAYLDYVLKAVRATGFIFALSGHAAIPVFSADKLSSLRIGLPAREEQLEIVAHLDSVTAQTDAMIEKTRQSIALMRERRSAVISAAVTGRLDVTRGIEQLESELEEVTA